jgi:hypothetical protein
MATNFPENLDSLINPQPTDSVAVVSHSAQHTNANDAIEALQAKVGVNNSAVTTSLDYRVKSLETAALDAEGIQDIAAALITNGSHTNITVSYSDEATPPRLNLVATYDNEEVVDAIATALTAGTGITKTYNENPPNYLGDYNNGYSYALNDVVSIPVGSPYGIVGSYFIRSGNPGNPGYPPEPGGAPNASWTLYNFSQTITIAVDTSSIATQSYVTTAISNLIDSSPALLNTLNEIAAAINDDANFATTVSTAITNAISTANSYTDTAVASLSNSIGDPINGYIPVGDIGVADGVASLGPDGFIPNTQLNIDERIQDTASLMITSATHQGISVTYDDTTGRLSFVAEALTAEVAQDFIAPLFAHAFHTNVTATYDDSNNRIVLESSGGGSGSGTGGSLTNSWWLGA